MPDQSVFVRSRLSPRGVEALRRTVGALFATAARVEVRGRDYLPASGRCIVATNHLSRFDGALLFTQTPTPKLTMLVADKYRSNPLFRWLLESVNIIWVNREATTPATIKAALQTLREGYILGIAPEGTRSPTHALQPGKTGAAFLAVTAGVPIVPVGVTNTDDLVQALKRLHRIRLTVTIGKPFWLTAPGQRERVDSKTLETYTTEVMCRIAALLPPEYRGVYADHPRLKELLAGDE